MLTLEKAMSDPANRRYGKVETYRKHLAPAVAGIEAKADVPNAKYGTISGYLSVWDKIDLGGEVVRKGAFTKTLAESGGKIPLMAKHWASGGDILQAVGTFTKLEEDDYGLKFEAAFFGDQFSQEVRDKIISLHKGGVRVGSSIGYRVIQYGFIKDEGSDRTILELRELALGEGTVTLKPMNPFALVTDAKSEDIHTVLSVFDPIRKAETSEEKAELVEKLGGKESVETLCVELKALAAATLSLIPLQPQDTGSKAGNNDGANGGDVGKDDADSAPKLDAVPATPRVDLNAERLKMEQRRMELRRLASE